MNICRWTLLFYGINNNLDIEGVCSRFPEIQMEDELCLSGGKARRSFSRLGHNICRLGFSFLLCYRRKSRSCWGWVPCLCSPERMRSECGSLKGRSKSGIRAGQAHNWEKAYFKTHGWQQGSDERVDKCCPPGSQIQGRQESWKKQSVVELSQDILFLTGFDLSRGFCIFFADLRESTSANRPFLRISLEHYEMAVRGTIS